MKIIDFDKLPPKETEGHSSKGNQPKWDHEGQWYKADHMGYEALSEVLISRLMEKSNIGEYVAYEPVKICYSGKHIPGCKSKNFRKKGEQLIPLERLHRAYKGTGLAQALARLADAGARMCYTVDFVEAVTGLQDIGRYFAALISLDAFFLNEDRHTNNLAVLRQEETKAFRRCPVFDNGLSLLSDTNDYPLEGDLYECIRRVKAKPFSENFDEQLEAAEKLYGPTLKLRFTKNDVTEELKKMDGLYSEAILRRAEQIVFEQMRKYRVLFD